MIFFIDKTSIFDMFWLLPDFCLVISPDFIAYICCWPRLPALSGESLSSLPTMTVRRREGSDGERDVFRKQQSPERCAPGFGLRRSGPGWDTEKGKRDQKADHSGAKEIFAGDGAAAGGGIQAVGTLGSALIAVDAGVDLCHLLPSGASSA